MLEATPASCAPTAGQDCLVGAEVLAALRFAAWPGSQPGEGTCAASCPPPPATVPVAAVPAGSSAEACTHSSASSREQVHHNEESDVECRPRKLRVLASSSGRSTVRQVSIPRRSYTWRGAACRHHQPAGDSTAAVTTADALCSTDVAGPCGGAERSEGDKEWAALTTWLRMNLHHPRTAKKVLMFLGSRDPGSGRWSFDLNPALTWGDLSADTQLRLRGLVEEAASAFRRKYPGRSPEHWRLKSQKYKPPGQGATYQVCLGDLVPSLHALCERFDRTDEQQQQCGASSSSGAAMGPGSSPAGAPAAACYSDGSSEQTSTQLLNSSSYCHSS